MRPSIGCIVIYRSRTGKYSVPAIITATKDTLIQENVDKGYIEGLSEDLNVHLTVFTPGKPGKRTDAKDFKVVPKNGTPISENVNGCYQEWDVPQVATPERYKDQEPGTWCWQIQRANHG